MKKGDEVEVQPTEDGGLTVYPVGREGGSPGTLDIALSSLASPGDLVPVLRALYAGGWERIVIRATQGFPGDLLFQLRATATRLPGLEVLSETRDRVELVASLDAGAFPLAVVLRRLELTGAAVLEDAMEALAEASPDLAAAAMARAQDGDRLRRLARRQTTIAVSRPGLTPELTGSLRDAVILRSSAESLAAIVRHGETIADTVARVLTSGESPAEAHLERFGTTFDAVEVVREAAAGALLGRDPQRALGALRAAPTAWDLAQAAAGEVAEARPRALALHLRRVAVLLEGIVTRSVEVAEDALEAAGGEATDLWEPRGGG